MRGLETQFRQWLAIQIAEDRNQTDRGLGIAAGDTDPDTPPPPNSWIKRDIGVVGDGGTYYVPIEFKPECMTCHASQAGFSMDPEADPVQLAAQYPFRVGRVTMPYKQTHEVTSQMRACLVALGMLIVAVTLYVLHTIVRYLILRPMDHLRDVSDRITRGDTNQRALINTEDEFRDLADAFNRMLRHLTETQDKINEVNQELDSRVDQLAQLNLQLYEANRLKSDFLANMSHELRTPLNSIIGFSDVLQGIESLNDKQRRWAANIQKSGRLLLEMINDILDLAKVEAGKMEVRPAEFALTRIVEAQCDMMASLIEDKQLELITRFDDPLDRPIQDANKLGQILNNLLSNAIKFTPEGGTITVSVRHQMDRFMVRVDDTGVGISPEDQRVVFEKFRQSKKVLDGDGLTREHAGTGLGLSIVKELAKLLGGEIEFESELGRGSSFWVSLPYNYHAAETVDVPAATAAGGPHPQVGDAVAANAPSVATAASPTTSVSDSAMSRA